MSGKAPRLLFDEHVNVPACRALQAMDLDVVHALEVGLGHTDDPEILRWAQQEDRILVTRNYQDFAPLVQALAARGETFPGVLFLAASVRQSDVRAHVRAVTDWLAEGPDGVAAVANSFGWLR